MICSPDNCFASARLCHLEVMDHSPRFWALLESRRPDHREDQRWLRRYGALLTL